MIQLCNSKLICEKSFYETVYIIHRDYKEPSTWIRTAGCGNGNGCVYLADYFFAGLKLSF